VPGLSLAHCEVGPSRALHCAGIVSHTRAELYVWGARSTVVLGLFLSSQGPEAVAAEAAELVTGLDPGT